ncbi:MAG: hypothetical protein HY582_05265 [Candidatus Omnitrophica bacterium]|nr:hypothetical protein [Candidatus Omnitrophota bacterium]
MNNILLVFSSDVGARLQIQTLAKKELIDCFFLSYGDHVADMVKRLEPFFLIIDFTSEGAQWSIKHLSEIKSRYSTLRIIGLVGPEVGEGDITRFERSGCDTILAKDSLMQQLPLILGARL